jgi:hypothetical protein
MRKRPVGVSNRFWRGFHYGLPLTILMWIAIGLFIYWLVHG